jgi:hypothetical protein
MVSSMVRWSWFLSAVGCALFVGCTGGSSGPPVFPTTGRVVENGKPVAIDKFNVGYNCLEVDFYPVDSAGKLVNAPHYPVFPAQDGSFTLAGEKGKGIETGKYRVAVRRVDRMQTVQPDKAGRMDAWKGKYDENKSPFLVDVTGSQGEILIDLAKGDAGAPSKADRTPKP